MLLRELNATTRLSSGQEKTLTVTKTNQQRYADKLVSIIQSNCSEFLSEKPWDEYLYRGTKTNNQIMFVGASRDDRLPVGQVASGYKSNRQLTQLVADWYMSLCGFTALRSNSMFCSSDREEAASWGNLYVIFPINGFKYGYSSVYSGTTAGSYDFEFEDDDNQMSENAKQVIINNNYRLTNISNENNNAFKAVAEYFVKLNSLKNKNLTYAMNINKDVWIKGKYIAIQRKEFFNLDLYDRLDTPKG